MMPFIDELLAAQGLCVIGADIVNDTFVGRIQGKPFSLSTRSHLPMQAHELNGRRVPVARIADVEAALG